LQLKTLLNKRYPLKSHVYDSVTTEDKKGAPALVVAIKPRKNGVKYCSNCGQRVHSGYDTLASRDWAFIAILGMAVFLRYAPRRVNCPQCGPTVEKLPWSHSKSPVSIPLMLMLSYWSKHLSYTAVTRHFGVTYQQVITSVRYVVEWGMARRCLEEIRAIGVDEIQVKLGHTYMTLVYQIDCYRKRLLWAGEDRREDTLHQFFDEFAPMLPNIRYVCSDMWRGYLAAIKKRIPHALHILDRFHIVQNLNKAMDEVRRQEAKELRAKGYYPHLTGTRFCFLKRKENLTSGQKGLLAETLKYNLRSVRAYLLKEEFNKLWDYSNVAWAEKFLNAWCTRVMRSRIKPLKKFSRSMRRHQPLIMNYFRARGVLSSGVVEGLNNLAKVTMRKSFGFKTADTLKLSLYHQLGDLPVPQLTHKLW